MNALIINCSPVRTGATAEIAGIVSEQLSDSFSTRSICIDDYQFGFCRGCKSCHTTARCVQQDDVELMMNEFEWADMIVWSHLPIGVIFLANSRHSLTDARPGAIPMNPMLPSAGVRKDM